MSCSFEFATATRIVFGAGRLSEIGTIAREFGQRALVVTGRGHGRARGLLAGLAEAGVECSIFSVTGEPEVATVQSGVAQAKENGCELVISFGGGSAIDTGKAVAAMLTNDGELLQFLEVIGQGRALQ